MDPEGDQDQGEEMTVTEIETAEPILGEDEGIRYPADDAAELLDEVATKASQLNVVREQAEQMQLELDQLVVRSRTAGLRYREIAIASGRSVAWVQASLIRSETRARPR